MLNNIKKHKFVMITFIIEVLLFWIVFYSGIILPFINPSIDEYETLVQGGTSFPRDYIQGLLWHLLHAPSSLIIDSILPSGFDLFFLIAIFQNCFIVHLIEKHIISKRKLSG
ncbi:hypothetical protein [Vallitalea okinawensis]|uniref:hypothetical protein n=1 Tax=Vallitalea okinawensis TaxID=2078660 RepID=UPI000CFC6F77|nr:hypothetical protein [Vallitalea okinawensis]